MRERPSLRRRRKTAVLAIWGLVHGLGAPVARLVDERRPDRSPRLSARKRRATPATNLALPRSLSAWIDASCPIPSGSWITAHASGRCSPAVLPDHPRLAPTESTDLPEVRRPVVASQRRGSTFATQLSCCRPRNTRCARCNARRSRARWIARARTANDRRARRERSRRSGTLLGSARAMTSLEATARALRSAAETTHDLFRPVIFARVGDRPRRARGALRRGRRPHAWPRRARHDPRAARRALRDPRAGARAFARGARRRVTAHLGGRDPAAYGRWIWFPWSRRLAHVLPKNEFREVRTEGFVRPGAARRRRDVRATRRVAALVEGEHRVVAAARLGRRARRRGGRRSGAPHPLGHLPPAPARHRALRKVPSCVPADAQDSHRPLDARFEQDVDREAFEHQREAAVRLRPRQPHLLDPVLRAVHPRRSRPKYPPGFKKEVSLPSGKRTDAYNSAKKEVRELKPNNPRASARGEKQVAEYCNECDNEFGSGHTGTVVTYDP